MSLVLAGEVLNDHYMQSMKKMDNPALPGIARTEQSFSGYVREDVLADGTT